MSQPRQSAVRDRRLRRLSPDDFALLRPHLHRMATPLRLQLIVPNTPIRQLFFPETGFGSFTGSRGEVEAGIVGREGLVGAAPVLLGSDRTPHDVYVHPHGLRRDGMVCAFGITGQALLTVPFSEAVPKKVDWD